METNKRKKLAVAAILALILIALGFSHYFKRLGNCFRSAETCIYDELFDQATQQFDSLAQSHGSSFCFGNHPRKIARTCSSVEQLSTALQNPERFDHLDSHQIASSAFDTIAELGDLRTRYHQNGQVTYREGFTKYLQSQVEKSLRNADSDFHLQLIEATIDGLNKLDADGSRALQEKLIQRIEEVATKHAIRLWKLHRARALLNPNVQTLAQAASSWKEVCLALPTEEWVIFSNKLRHMVAHPATASPPWTVEFGSESLSTNTNHGLCRPEIVSTANVFLAIDTSSHKVLWRKQVDFISTNQYVVSGSYLIHWSSNPHPIVWVRDIFCGNIIAQIKFDQGVGFYRPICNAHYLTISFGDQIAIFDLKNRKIKRILICEKIRSLLPCDYSEYVAAIGKSGSAYCFQVTNGDLISVHPNDQPEPCHGHWQSGGAILFYRAQNCHARWVPSNAGHWQHHSSNVWLSEFNHEFPKSIISGNVLILYSASKLSALLVRPNSSNPVRKIESARITRNFQTIQCCSPGQVHGEFFLGSANGKIARRFVGSDLKTSIAYEWTANLPGAWLPISIQVGSKTIWVKAQHESQGIQVFGFKASSGSLFWTINSRGIVSQPFRLRTDVTTRGGELRVGCIGKSEFDWTFQRLVFDRLYNRNARPTWFIEQMELAGWGNLVRIRLAPNTRLSNGSQLSLKKFAQVLRSANCDEIDGVMPVGERDAMIHLNSRRLSNDWRYASLIFSDESGKRLGTGPYTKRLPSPDGIELEKNPFCGDPSVSSVILLKQYQQSAPAIDELRSNQMDVLFNVDSHKFQNRVVEYNGRIETTALLLNDQRSKLPRSIRRAILSSASLVKSSQSALGNSSLSFSHSPELQSAIQKRLVELTNGKSTNDPIILLVPQNASQLSVWVERHLKIWRELGIAVQPRYLDSQLLESKIYSGQYELALWNTSRFDANRLAIELQRIWANCASQSCKAAIHANNLLDLLSHPNSISAYGAGGALRYLQSEFLMAPLGNRSSTVFVSPKIQFDEKKLHWTTPFSIRSCYVEKSDSFERKTK